MRYAPETETLIPTNGGGFDVAHAPEVAGTLVARSSRGGGQTNSPGHNADQELVVTHALTDEGFDASEDGTGRGTPLVPVSVALRGRDGGATAELGDDLAHALRASGGGGDKPHVYIAFSAKDHGADAGEIAPTLRAGGHTGSHANAGVMPAVAVDYTNCLFGADVTGTLKHAQHKSNSGHGVMAGSLVRRLMPVECDRLQGFPDDYTDIPWRGKAHAPDGPRYKADGNSMHTGTVGWVLARIRDVDTLVIPEQVAA